MGASFLMASPEGSPTYLASLAIRTLRFFGVSCNDDAVAEIALCFAGGLLVGFGFSILGD